VTPEDPTRLLADALDAVPGPPLHELSEKAVREWLDCVRAGLVSRRDGRRLASAVEAVLWQNYLTAEHVRRTQAKATRHAEIQAAREAGTHWAELEERRRARRPTHVEVDPEAWAVLRQRAIVQAVTIGELVGHLVTRETGRVALGHTALHAGRRGPPGGGRRAGCFARIDVEEEAWRAVRARAIAANLTVARYVGLVVEDEARHAGWQPAS